MTPAGTVASTRSPAVRSSAGRRARTPRAIAHSRGPYMTNTEPRVATWSVTSTKTPGVCTPVTTSSTLRCPELDTGRNSVSPCTSPRIIPCHSVMRPPGYQRHDSHEHGSFEEATVSVRTPGEQPARHGQHDELGEQGDEKVRAPVVRRCG